MLGNVALELIHRTQRCPRGNGFPLIPLNNYIERIEQRHAEGNAKGIFVVAVKWPQYGRPGEKIPDHNLLCIKKSYNTYNYRYN